MSLPEANNRSFGYHLLNQGRRPISCRPLHIEEELSVGDIVPVILYFAVNADRLGYLENDGICEGGRAPLEDGEVRSQSHALVRNWVVLKVDMKDVYQWECAFIVHATHTRTGRNTSVICWYSITVYGPAGL